MAAPGAGGGAAAGPVKVAGGAEDSLLNVISKMLSDQGSYAYEKRTNSIIVIDTPEKLDNVARVIEKIDVPPKQIHLQIRMIEMSDEDYDEMGVNWGTGNFGLTGAISGMSSGTFFPFLGSRTFSQQNSIMGSLAAVPTDAGVVAADAPFIAYSDDDFSGGAINLGTLDFTQLAAVLNVIRTKTRGKIVQAPMITTLSNEEATIAVGELVRFAEQDVSASSTSTTTSWKEASSSPVRLGIQILVIPYVTGPANDVILTLVVRSEQFTNPGQPFRSFGPLDLPQTTQAVIMTKMLLRNHETGVIAGLRTEQEGETIRKIPLLGDIPLLGWIFKSRQRTKRAKNLLVFVTPSVVNFEEHGDLRAAVRAAAVAREERFRVYEESEERFALPSPTPESRKHRWGERIGPSPTPEE